MKQHHFPMELQITPVAGGWKLIADYPYYVFTGLWPIVVPAGMVTDYASIPRVFWFLIAPWGKHGPAAIIHDYLYFCTDTIRVPDPDNKLRRCRNNRKISDRIFLIAMKQSGVSWLKRRIMYRAVRLFGGPAWQKKGK